MIEALARIICKDSSNRGNCEKCGFYPDCNKFETAQRIVDAGYAPVKWIPVSERLPEDGETVLVYGSKGGIYTAWCNRRYQNVEWHKLNSKNHYCNPTHWMPLPEPPKEK